MIKSDRTPAVLLLSGSIALLGGALGFQYLGGLHPCDLCIYQRIPHAVVIVLAVVAILTSNRTSWPFWSILLAGLALLAGSMVAGFHVGVEQLWWQGTPGCQNAATPETLEELRKQIMEQPVVACDTVAWSLFGISMASYNFVFSLALAIFALWSSRRIPRTEAGI